MDIRNYLNCARQDCRHCLTNEKSYLLEAKVHVFNNIYIYIYILNLFLSYCRTNHFMTLIDLPIFLMNFSQTSFLCIYDFNGKKTVAGKEREKISTFHL